jgi:hypothetical protein
MIDVEFLRGLASRLQTGELNGELTSDEDIARLIKLADDLEDLADETGICL